MEKIKTFFVDLKRPNRQLGIPTHWLREYLPDGKGDLDLYQEGDKLILTPKKAKEKAGCK